MAHPTQSLDHARIDKSGDCWIWTGVHSNGYGLVYQRWDSLRRRSIYIGAHRLSYAEAYGPIPDGLDVLHRCDNPPCVRPDHLFLGTAKDNAADMVRKGRARGRIGRGDQNPAARLTWEAVRIIRARHQRGETITDLAHEFGVDRTTVNLVVLGRTWKESVA